MAFIKPIIYDYHDFREYLKDYQAGCHKHDKKFTKSYVCKLLGLPNSRSYFNQVLLGRTVSDLYIDRFIHVFELKDEEAQYFRILVRLDKTDNANEREILSKELMEYYKVNVDTIEKQKLKALLSHWYNFLILNIIEQYPIKKKQVSFLSYVLPKINDDDFIKAIDNLLEHNILSTNENGYIRTNLGSLNITCEKDNPLKINLFAQYLEVAQAMLKEYNIPDNYFLNTIRVTEQTAKNIHDLIDRFRKEVLSLIVQETKDTECKPQKIYSFLVYFSAITKELPLTFDTN